MSDVPIEVLRKRQKNPRVKDNVTMLCAAYPTCKGDYRILIYRYYREICGINISLKSFDQLRRAPAAESICRRYRELRQELPEKYTPSKGTTEKRAKRQAVYNEYYSPKLTELEWDGYTTKTPFED